ncbi:MAG: hypothetical protein HRT61_04440 [Ekhidna sp.]|nr:hypothetical protein [Ekhidna sp.]
MRFLLAFVFVLFMGFQSFGQKESTAKDVFPTENLSFNKDANRKSNEPKRKRISLIYVPNADKILYGNPCATQETHKMGFEYIVEPHSNGGSRSRAGKFLNNLWVKTKLVFTRSPFWKQILKSKINRCRTMSGDLVG